MDQASAIPANMASAAGVLTGHAHGVELAAWWLFIAVVVLASAWRLTPAYRRRRAARDAQVEAR
ncbi:MAG TPA: hypothetical protein VFX16_38175 [Pseudonocardiaceae bacterium]|nr:hypothetical protein [Pseudonocardiaceae bacterium]